jgi:hypothetical protein
MQDAASAQIRCPRGKNGKEEFNRMDRIDRIKRKAKGEGKKEKVET